ncbi:MAG: hypothetical protein WCU00_07525 [Candidatus Latescibacterota bacterium]
MDDQTQQSLSNKTFDTTHLVINNHDRTVLRDLASRVAELASRPCEKVKRDLWYRHNALEPTRPLIFCDPEHGWNEIITERDICCSGDMARYWETILRKEIFWGEEMGDDRVVQDTFTVPYIHTESDWGMHETKIGGKDGGSYIWDSPLKSFDDIEKIHFPKITVDYAATEDILSLAKEIFGNILPVRVKGSWWWSLGMTWTLVKLRGLEQIMFDVYDYPEKLKELMNILSMGTLAKLDLLEKNNLLSLNNDGTYVGSGGFGWTAELPGDDFEGKVRTMDMWGFGESQETITFSPEAFAEFIFPYQLPVLERFGLNCYGCCEPLDKRWDSVKKIPRLRRVSVSPWANIRDMAEKLENNYIFSMKPNPAELAVPVVNEERIRKGLREAIGDTRNCITEIIMKDNHTLGGNPLNAVSWCRIALEEADKSR